MIHNCDCVEFMRTIDAESVDMVLTSPPYDSLRTYDGIIDTWNDDKWKNAIAGLFRIIKVGGVVVWIVNDATVDGSETGTSFRQALFAMDCGFRLHDTMIWNKGGFTATGSLAVRYAPVFEYMFILSKGAPKTFNPIIDRKCKRAGAIRNGKVRQADGSFKPESTIGNVQREIGQRFNIWDIFPVCECSEHPATFAEQLAIDHIKSWSNEGDLVFDPFAGSGTTGVAAMKFNRRFIGCELNKEYAALASRRIENAKLPLFEGRE